MPNQDFLTDEELDALLEEAPVFDPQAVKSRVLAEIAADVKPTAAAKNVRHIGRGLLLAAAICVLSVSCLAVADYASGGRIAAALGITPAVKTQEPTTPVKQAEPTPAKPKPASPPLPEPEPEPAELGTELANSFSLTPTQTQLLRPAVQNINQTVKNQDVDMTVLQTLGDSQYLYIVVRFDFPEGVPVNTTYRFSDMDFLVDGEYGNSWGSSIVECTDHSVTYLISARSQEAFSGQTVTLRYSDYGFYKPDEPDVTTLTLPSGKVSTVQIGADGNIVWTDEEKTVSIGDQTTIQIGDVSIVVGGEESESAGEAVPSTDASPAQTPDADAEPAREPIRTQVDDARGIITNYYADGSILVIYDGAHGDQYLAVADEGTPAVRILHDPSGHPGFNTLLAGQWEQSWTLSYQDLSKTWTGTQSIFDPNLILTSFRISPLSCSMEFAGTLPTDDPEATIPYVHDMDAVLVLADGSTQAFPLHSSDWTSHTEDDGSYAASTEIEFSSPMDPTNVTAVILDGVTFPLT